MDIWIIIDGEKSSAIHDYDIRKRIESGELSASTPAWHEGLDTWRPLGEMSLFSGEFDRPLVGTTVSSEAAEGVRDHLSPPPLPEKPHLLTRFWARWFDLCLFAGIWWIAMWSIGRDIEDALSNPWVILFQYVPWFVIETLMLHRFATTPGKWLLGIRVVNQDGSFLSLSEATRRSGRVFFLGIGFGWDLLAIICQIMALITTKRLGRPLWDHVGGHRVTVAPLQPMRLLAFIMMFFIGLQLEFIVIAPYAMESVKKEFPALYEQFQKNPPWYLPKR